jgi:urease accessory protein
MKNSRRPRPVLFPGGRRNDSDPSRQDKFGRPLSPWEERRSERVLGDAQPDSASESRERALLQTWFSPAFPIGSFAYSQGLESAADAGLVRDEATLGDWIADLLRLGSISNDLILAACAWKSAAARAWPELNASAELAAALQPSAERRFEAVTQGSSFLDAISAAWPCEALSEALDRLAKDAPIPYAAAAGLAAAAHGLRLGPTLEAFALAFVSSQASAAIRLGLIGQTAAQRIMAALLPAAAQAVSRAAAATLDDIGSACFSADLSTLEHETQYTRLFRT